MTKLCRQCNGPIEGSRKASNSKYCSKKCGEDFTLAKHRAACDASPLASERSKWSIRIHRVKVTSTRPSHLVLVHRKLGPVSGLWIPIVPAWAQKLPDGVDIDDVETDLMGKHTEVTEP